MKTRQIPRREFKTRSADLEISHADFGNLVMRIFPEIQIKGLYNYGTATKRSITQRLCHLM
jgi:hypothetical protein